MSSLKFPLTSSWVTSVISWALYSAQHPPFLWHKELTKPVASNFLRVKMMETVGLAEKQALIRTLRLALSLLREASWVVLWGQFKSPLKPSLSLGLGPIFYKGNSYSFLLGNIEICIVLDPRCVISYALQQKLQTRPQSSFERDCLLKRWSLILSKNRPRWGEVLWLFHQSRKVNSSHCKYYGILFYDWLACIYYMCNSDFFSKSPWALEEAMQMSHLRLSIQQPGVLVSLLWLKALLKSTVAVISPSWILELEEVEVSEDISSCLS